MITSSSIQYISQVLNEPQNISAADKDSIDALIQAYPYFVPARYMEAAGEQQKQPFQAPVMAKMQLYTGNWLLYNKFLQLAANDFPAPVAAPAQPIVAAPVEPQEEVQEPAGNDSFIQAQEPEVITETLAPVFEEADNTAHITVVEEMPEAVIAEPATTEEILAVTETIDDSEIIDESFIVPEPVITQHHEPVKKGPLYKDLNNGEAYVPENDESFILPVYTEDYFLHQGMHVSNNIPTDIPKKDAQAAEDKQLMVVMSFAEWLVYFKNRKEKEADEVKDQKAVKTMWQKEKLAAAMEEENEEIPEKVFEMAVNSITKEDDLASESLAEIHGKQGRYDKAIEMYRKLSLRNPQKKAYFARKIEIILKEKES